jgi:hypothetical protein
MMDSNGCNTTAVAAVLAAIEGAERTRGSIDGSTIAVLAATGPVGQRVARLLLRLPGNIEVRVGSRQLDRAQAVASHLREISGKQPTPFATADQKGLAQGIEKADVIIAAGAAGVKLLPEDLRRASGAKVLIDLNAVPPFGIEGVEAGDKGKEREGVLCWGALGVGGTKMKIHKQAIQELFKTNDRVLDAEAILKIGQSLIAKKS